MTDTKDAAQVLRQEIPDTIDWSHVDPKYRYMARDSNDVVWLYDIRGCAASSLCQRSEQ